MKQVFGRSPSLKDVQTHFCPGCHHGSIHRLVAEALDEYDIREKTIGCASVGCSVFLYGYFNIDVVESPHGRAPAVATGVKRARPDRIVFTYQGDGDLAAISTSEIIHAANRGEDITVIFVNNTTYGMTGGQMAPTTVIGQKTITTPEGRSAQNDG
ncbi:MAG TPA: thiamine pyrophosphate-dependent enzyme, partial [Geobacteraceae bacterium]|nr:thiamine pyrophosphate-dependent enzyme [Geobacteraceae bacterium]